MQLSEGVAEVELFQLILNWSRRRTPYVSYGRVSRGVAHYPAQVSRERRVEELSKCFRMLGVGLSTKKRRSVSRGSWQ